VGRMIWGEGRVRRKACDQRKTPPPGTGRKRSREEDSADQGKTRNRRYGNQGPRGVERTGYPNRKKFSRANA